MTPEAISKIEALIEEAVHSNHPNLDKRKMGSGSEANTVRKNRNELAGKINHYRGQAASVGNNVPRHNQEQVKNFQNNVAKATSFQGKTPSLDEMSNKRIDRMHSNPRALIPARK